MRVLAFDPSAAKGNLGWSVLEDGGEISLLAGGVLEIRAEDQVRRVGLAHSEVSRLIREFHPDVVAFERTIGGGGFAPTREEITLIAGAIIVASFAAGVECRPTHGSSASLAFTGHGKSKKSATMRRAKELFFPDAKHYKDCSVGSDGKQNFEHLADALMIGFYHLT